MIVGAVVVVVVVFVSVGCCCRRVARTSFFFFISFRIFIRMLMRNSRMESKWDDGKRWIYFVSQTIFMRTSLGNVWTFFRVICLPFAHAIVALSTLRSPVQSRMIQEKQRITSSQKCTAHELNSEFECVGRANEVPTCNTDFVFKNLVDQI